MGTTQSRRRVLAGLAGSSVAAVLFHPRRTLAQEDRLETTSVRLMRIPSVCLAPQYVCEELLHAEGFTDITYVDAVTSAAFNDAIAGGKADFTAHYASPLAVGVANGGAITILAGLHVGCLEVLGHQGTRTIADLKGKSVAVTELGSAEHMFVSLMAAHIGLDPVKDVRWLTSKSPTPAELFVDGKCDAVLGTPPMAQELRARQIGHVIASSSTDRPWSQYFCCMLSGNRNFVRKNPIATKRVLRAILKAVDLCATEQVLVAQKLVDGRFTKAHDYAVQALRELSYDKWREYDPEDTLRFYALRLHELGFIKSSPQRVIADGADWRFLNELKRELKG